MYSQNLEEQYIREALDGITGRFLDIGAWDPADLSNTRALWEAGWSGVMIEPSPAPFDRLAAIYGREPTVELLNVAVISIGSGPVAMHLSNTPYSTTEASNFHKWKDYVRALGDQYFDHEAMVHGVTLADIYRDYAGPRSFDFVSIDTEGTSVQLLHDLLSPGCARVLPKCICVEYDDRRTEALAIAAANNYQPVYRSPENLVLVRQ